MIIVYSNGSLKFELRCTLSMDSCFLKNFKSQFLYLITVNFYYIGLNSVLLKIICSFVLFNMATRKFEIIYEAHTLFLSAILENSFYVIS